MNDYTIYYGLTFLALIITVGAQIFINTKKSKMSKEKVEPKWREKYSIKMVYKTSM